MRIQDLKVKFKLNNMENFKKLLIEKKQEILIKSELKNTTQNILQKAILENDLIKIKELAKTRSGCSMLLDNYTPRRERDEILDWVAQETRENPTALKALKIMFNSKKHEYHFRIFLHTVSELFFYGNPNILNFYEDIFFKVYTKIKKQRTTTPIVEVFISNFSSVSYLGNTKKDFLAPFALKMLKKISDYETENKSNKYELTSLTDKDDLKKMHIHLMKNLNQDEFEEYLDLMNENFKKINRNFKEQIKNAQNSIKPFFEKNNRDFSNNQEVLNFWINWQLTQEKFDLPLVVNTEYSHGQTMTGTQYGEMKKTLNVKELKLPLLFIIKNPELAYLSQVYSPSERQKSIEQVIQSPLLPILAIASNVPETYTMLEELHKINPDFWIDSYKNFGYQVFNDFAVNQQFKEKIVELNFKNSFLPDSLYCPFIEQYFSDQISLKKMETSIKEHSSLIQELYTDKLTNGKNDFFMQVIDRLKGNQRSEETYNKVQELLKVLSEEAPKYCLKNLELLRDKNWMKEVVIEKDRVLSLLEIIEIKGNESLKNKNNKIKKTHLL